MTITETDGSLDDAQAAFLAANARVTAARQHRQKAEAALRVAMHDEVIAELILDKAKAAYNSTVLRKAGCGR